MDNGSRYNHASAVLRVNCKSEGGGERAGTDRTLLLDSGQERNQHLYLNVKCRLMALLRWSPLTWTDEAVWHSILGVLPPCFSYTLSLWHKPRQTQFPFTAAIVAVTAPSLSRVDLCENLPASSTLHLLLCGHVPSVSAVVLMVGNDRDAADGR